MRCFLDAKCRQSNYTAGEYLDRIKTKGDEYSIVALAICIGNARDKGLKELTLQGMKSVMDLISNHENYILEGVDLSSLIRCAVQLLLKSMAHENTEKDKKQCLEASQMMVNILDQGLNILRKQDKRVVRTKDIMWIISKAYNSALHQSQDENMESSLALTDLALKVS